LIQALTSVSKVLLPSSFYIADVNSSRPVLLQGQARALEPRRRTIEALPKDRHREAAAAAVVTSMSKLQASTNYKTSSNMNGDIILIKSNILSNILRTLGDYEGKHKQINANIQIDSRPWQPLLLQQRPQPQRSLLAKIRL